tara:strand:+ start:146 stop:448 length:303 start_codon:yes stop_codon:yes gene_type:complete
MPVKVEQSGKKRKEGKKTKKEEKGASLDTEKHRHLLACLAETFQRKFTEIQEKIRCCNLDRMISCVVCRCHHLLQTSFSELSLFSSSLFSPLSRGWGKTG